MCSQLHTLPTNVDKTNRKLKDGSVVQIPCPKPVKQYTGRMGGVDRFDQKRCYYSVSRRSRRWWLRLFYFLVDTCIVNAHILHTSVHPDDSYSLVSTCSGDLFATTRPRRDEQVFK